MRVAAVGHQCMDCVQAASHGVPVIVAARTPFVTYALIAVNVVVFALQIASAGLQSQLALVPALVAHDGEYYRLVSSAFVHFGLVHILFNMYALYVLGPPLERSFGWLRFAALYALSALGGSVMVYLFSPVMAQTAGASGAIFGLFGATLVAARRLNLDVRWLIGLVVVNLVITFGFPGVSWQGHIGGLIVGTLVTVAYVYAPRPVAAGVLAALLALFAVLIYWRTGAIMDLMAEMIGRR
jgi:membrane associated rhomboid family serine protease